MKKTLILIVCAFCGFSELSSSESTENLVKRGLNKSEGRAAAFFPASHNFRQIYGDTLLSLQFEQGRIFKNNPNLEFWGNLEWIFANGYCGNSCGSSRINILNVSFGLKVIGPVFRDRIYLYAGLGPDLGITLIKNQSNFTSHNCNIGIGGIAKSGCQIFLSNHFFLDFFADYLYLPMHFYNTADVGGGKVGIGLSGRY
jgi:hypothetical protein